MSIQKIFFRIIAGILALNLLSAGAVPAVASCRLACGCAHTKSHDRVTPGMTRPGLHARSQPAILTMMHPGSIKIPHPPARHADIHCREGLTAVSCDMESSQAFETLQRTSPAPARSDRCQEIPLVRGLYNAFLSQHPHARPVAPQEVSARAAPVPIFLQSVSLLI